MIVRSFSDRSFLKSKPDKVMKEFRVELTNPPQGVYFPGMAVTGTVVCETDKPKDYKQIVVTITGGARVHWSESHGTGNDRRTYHYSSSEHYMTVSAVLWDKDRDAMGGTLPAGSYRFNFSLVLSSDNLPPSYTGSYGAITYSLEGRVAKKALKKDKKAVANLTVGSVVKVDSPDLAMPLSQEISKTLCCLCCESGPIVMTASIPRRGFCVGYDTIPVEIQIENGSSRRIQHVSLSLMKQVLYTAEGHHRYDNVSCVSFSLRAVEPRETATLRPDPLVVATNINPTQQTCRILTINYFVVVAAQVELAFNPTISLPVTIGNVPLQGGGAMFEAPPVDSHYPSAWEPPPSYPSDPMPPPIGFVDPVKQ